MGKKILSLTFIAFFWLFLPAFEPQSVPDTDGGRIKFQIPEEILISSIAGQLTRCETYMDYVVTQGWCRSFPTKIGSVTDFGIGYLIRLWPEDYKAGDSFRWNFKGPKRQDITGATIVSWKMASIVGSRRREARPVLPSRGSQGFL